MNVGQFFIMNRFKKGYLIKTIDHHEPLSTGSAPLKYSVVLRQFQQNGKN